MPEKTPSSFRREKCRCRRAAPRVPAAKCRAQSSHTRTDCNFSRICSAQDSGSADPKSDHFEPKSGQNDPGLGLKYLEIDPKSASGGSQTTLILCHLGRKSFKLCPKCLTFRVFSRQSERNFGPFSGSPGPLLRREIPSLLALKLASLALQVPKNVLVRGRATCKMGRNSSRTGVKRP